MLIKNKKIVLLGAASVGKTSIVNRYFSNKFSLSQETTIGAAYYSIKKDRIKLEIWDVAGQERYQSLIPMYYRNSKAAIVIFDLSDNNSFNKAKYWIKELKKNINEDIVIILVGNKFDLNIKKVKIGDINLYCSLEKIKYFECSAKLNMNVDIIFDHIINIFLNSIDDINEEDEDSSLKINNNNKKKISCC